MVVRVFPVPVAMTSNARMPLLTRLFNTRLDILTATLNRRDNPAYAQAIVDCRAMLTRVPTESFLVCKVWTEIESAWTNDFWLNPNPQRIDFLRLRVAPLLGLFLMLMLPPRRSQIKWSGSRWLFSTAPQRPINSNRSRRAWAASRRKSETGRPRLVPPVSRSRLNWHRRHARSSR